MACPIEIGKSLDRSISKYLPNINAVMDRKAADEIKDHLNDLWGKIATVRQYSGSGGYVVSISNIEAAVLKEYKKQLAAEAQFSRDFSFFNNDLALMTQERLESEAKVPGINEIFNNFPRLDAIGTQEQYDTYKNSEFFTGESGTLEDENAFRKFVTDKYTEKKPVIPDLEDLLLTPTVIDYLYSRSSKRLKKDIFAREVHKFVENNRAYMTIEEIIEKLTCL